MKTILNLILPLTIALGATLGLGVQAQSWDVPTQQQLIIKDYAQFLNKNYSGLKLQLKSYDFQAEKQLEQLEGFLQKDFGVETVKPGSLDVLSCTKIVCGGGGGNCTTCLH